MKRWILLVPLVLSLAAVGWVTPPAGIDAGYVADHYLPLSGGEIGPLLLPHTNRLRVGHSAGTIHFEVFKGYQASRAMPFLYFRDTLASVPVSTGMLYYTQDEFRFNRGILAPSVIADSFTLNDITITEWPDDSIYGYDGNTAEISTNTRVRGSIASDGNLTVREGIIRAGDQDYGTGQGYLQLRDSATDGEGVMRFYDSQLDVSWDGESTWRRYLHSQSPGDEFPDAVVKTGHVGNVSIDGNLVVNTNLVVGGGVDMQNTSISNINSVLLLGTDVRRTSSSHWLSLMGGHAWDRGAHLQLGGDSLDSGAQVAFGGADLLLAQAAAHGFTIRERDTWNTLFQVKGDGTAQVHGQAVATTAWVGDNYINTNHSGNVSIDGHLASSSFSGNVLLSNGISTLVYDAHVSVLDEAFESDPFDRGWLANACVRWDSTNSALWAGSSGNVNITIYSNAVPFPYAAYQMTVDYQDASNYRPRWYIYNGENLVATLVGDQIGRITNSAIFVGQWDRIVRNRISGGGPFLEYPLYAFQVSTLSGLYSIDAADNLISYQQQGVIPPVVTFYSNSTITPSRNGDYIRARSLSGGASSLVLTLGNPDSFFTPFRVHISIYCTKPDGTTLAGNILTPGGVPYASTSGGATDLLELLWNGNAWILVSVLEDIQ